MLQVLLSEYGDWRFKALPRLDSPVPGELVRGTLAPLECTLRVSPTVVITNSLPYFMEGFLVALASGISPGLAEGPPPQTDEQGSSAGCDACSVRSLIVESFVL